jgi:hypothetical protein
MIPPTNSEQEGACDGFISQGQAGGVLDQEPAPARGRGGTGLRSRMPVILNNSTDSRFCHKAKRLQALEDEMQVANAAYVQAVDRVSAYPCAILLVPSRASWNCVEDLHGQVTEVLREMLDDVDAEIVEPG